MSSYLIQFPLVCKCNCLCMFSLLCFLIRFHCSKMIRHSMFWILVEDKRIWRKGEKNKPCQTLRCRDVAMDMDVKEGRRIQWMSLKTYFVKIVILFYFFKPQYWCIFVPAYPLFCYLLTLSIYIYIICVCWLFCLSDYKHHVLWAIYLLVIFF